jgi:2-desacetyl-2-hydroxyethyl bacteriochlorophyllide A dehydrogenase
MKALCVHSANNIVVEERPMPVLQSATDILVKVKAGGICGSDVHIIHGTSPVAVYPRVPGHEIAAEIIDKGNEVHSFSFGDRVVIDPVISCGNCYQCRIGRRNVCRNLKVRSVHVDGGYQQYLVVPQQAVYRIPPNLSWEEAIMIEPFTIAAQVCSRAAAGAEDTVMIMGAGPVGLSVLVWAKLSGCICMVSDIVDYKLQTAANFGADLVINASKTDVKEELLQFTKGIGATVVVDAACTIRSLEQALEYVCPAGRVITLGFSKEPSPVSQLSITAREIDVRGSRLHNNKFPEVIASFESGRLNVKELISHRFEFTDIRQALDLIDDPAVPNGKVVLDFDL